METGPETSNRRPEEPEEINSEDEIMIIQHPEDMQSKLLDPQAAHTNKDKVKNIVYTNCFSKAFKERRCC